MSELPNNLSNFFYPKSVAVIGASRNPKKLGAIILKNIVESGFSGNVYPVNPNCQELNGINCVPDITKVPNDTELVIISIPAQQVGSVLTQVGEHGIKNAIVLSAGFKEIGGDGAKMEVELVQISKKYQINLLGPNCLGFFNNLAPINATFGKRVSNTGNLRFVTQSGAIASSIFDWAESIGLGVNEFITLGNKAVLNETDILNYFYNQDQNTLHNHTDETLSKVNPIGLYLEDIVKGNEFLNIANKITKTNPVFIIKPGKSKAAAAAMQSHTGAIAGADDVLDEVLKESSVIRCNSLEDFFDLARAFSWEEVPSGPNVAVISNAGGPAVISADAVIENGLNLAQLDQQTKEKLNQFLPREASIINPVDVLGDALADRYSGALETLLTNENVDSVVVILTPQLMTQIEQTAKIIGELSVKYKKPIFCSFMGGNLVHEGEQILNKFKIPSFRFPERAIYAVGQMWKYKQFLLREDEPVQQPLVVKPEPEGIIRDTIQEQVTAKNTILDNLTVDKLLRSVKINTPDTAIVDNFEQAKQFAKNYGWPVVLKFSSPGLLHKKDVGGIELDILNENQLDDAWHRLERKVEQLDESIKSKVKFQIQKDVMRGVEVIVGVKTDPVFGPVLLFGAGGSYANLISDKNLDLLPIEKYQAQKIVERSKVYSLLQKNSDEPELALDKLYDLIVRLGKLYTLIPEAEEIEINPVIVTQNNVWAVDGKMVLKHAEKPTAPSAPKLMSATCTKHEVLATQFNYFEFKAEQPLKLKPGQYISVKVAPDAIRAYSIAEYEDEYHFGLLVDTRPGGPGSKFFENLKPGDKMSYLGPFGVFTLNLEDEAEAMVFLATGTGVGATRTMIDLALKKHGSNKPIHLYFGLTKYEEIFWKDYFENLEKEYSNFKFTLVLYESHESWNGPTGYITEEFKKDYPDTCKVAVYLCGHRAMIADGVELSLANGCAKERIYQERFV